MTGKVKCTCGWSWNKSDSSKKDMYVCHECGRDNSNNMKNGGWLDNYADGGTMQEHQENYNDYEVSAPEGMIGDGFSNVGRNSSPAWGGQFQSGGKLKFLQPTSEKLPEGYRIPYSDPSSERAMSIGGEDGEPAYLIPSFKYGHPLGDPMAEFKKTGEHLGGPFKTWQEAEKWENETRHPAVERKENIMFPQEKFQMGGSVYPVNYVPQAQNGWLGNIENNINNSLNNPADRGRMISEFQGKSVINPKTKEKEIEAVDNIRHSFAGRFANEAIQSKFPSWMQYTGVPQAAGVAGANALGIGHELSTLFNSGDKRSVYHKVRESGEDIFNNAVGSAVGSLPLSYEKGNKLLLKLSDENKLPDGISGRGNDRYAKHQTGGSFPGATGFSYARTQGSAPSKGPRRNQTYKTDASAQNGKEIQYYREGLDWQPKSISKDGSIIKDDRGQWGKHKGEPTRINQSEPGSYIDMGPDPLTGEPLTEPLLGISDKGEKKMMYPGEKHKYKKDTKYVDEFPMAKNGLRQEQKSLQNLDQLTNFTNYNKPQPGGWLNKYK